MRLEKTINIMADYVPELLNDWLRGNLPVDISVLSGRWKGFRVVKVTFEAHDLDDLSAKIKAFNAMIEAKGYGPEAKQK